MAEFKLANDRDAVMRLQQSVVRFDGQPVWVVEATVERCLICELGGGNERYVATDQLDLLPVVVGNVQVGNCFAYIQRAPTRKWKQGLNNDNIHYGRMPWPLDRVRINSEAVGKSLKGEYAKAVDAITAVLDGVKRGVAFSTRWGVGKKDGVPHLFYKDKVVGVADEGELVLFPKFFYLRESLLEALNA